MSLSPLCQLHTDELWTVIVAQLLWISSLLNKSVENTDYLVQIVVQVFVRAPYLEAWTADERGTHFWKRGATSTVGTSTAIGSGNTNTHSGMDGPLYMAAEVVRNATHGGHNDWFIPSKDELNLMYLNRDLIGSFAAGTYWSSSVYSSSLVWRQYFNNGGRYRAIKATHYRVRAIRAF